MGGRALAPLDILEIVEGRSNNVDVRRDDEAMRLLKVVARADVIVALDEAGHCMSSTDFAALIAKYRDSGIDSLAFLIGGPDGHGCAATSKSALRLSLGRMTLPHALARVLLAEQLYRAMTILSGHPYHRA